ncbi:MAG: glycosyltransferase [Bacteroidetes bacterium]|nr:glycosyltransferase [Bacteroidota bacterium]
MPARRVLIVAYYVPPAGGPAVQRILQFIEYLADAGWQPEVVTVEEGAYPNRDPSLLHAIPDSVRVHRTAAFDPLALYQRMKGSGLPAGSLGDDPSLLERAARWVRANVFIPDARVGWWPFAHVRGKELLDRGRFDAILSSGAPHSVHLAGRSLARATGLPWVADLHDPWTDISYYDDFPHTGWARRLDARLERSVLADAAVITTVSPSWAELFRSKEDGIYEVVENGFDARDFALVHPEGPTRSSGSSLAESTDPPPSEPAPFTLSHVGKLYASRNPTAVWDALADLRDDGKIPDLTVRLIGTVDPAVLEAIEDRDLTDRIERVPFIPHAEAIQAMVSSSLLLLVIEPFAQARGMITSKLYEYLASGRPVLGVGPPDGDASALLSRHNAGQVVDWNDARSARDMILEHYTAWTTGAPRSGAAWEDIQEHNRQQQAYQMAECLDTACDVHRPAEASAS